MTMQGVILGTAAYMAPEQARGYPVDKRADIWAFGVIVYEMLTGTSLFSGNTVTDTLAHVVTREPDWTKVPPAARRLLQSCLEREPQRRLRDLGDAWRLWDDAPVQVSPRRSMLVPIIGAAVATAALTLLAVSYVPTPIEAPDVVRLQMTLPAGAQAETAFMVSPDGRRIAMHGVGSDGVRRVWLRELDQLETRPLPGAENAATGPIFWSPDSRWIVFTSEGKIKKIDIAGGPAQVICDVSRMGMIGGAWNRDGVIVFGSNPGSHPDGGSIFRVAAAGGTPTALTKVDPSRQEYGHRHPAFLPDQRHFLYLRTSTTLEQTGIYVGSIDASPGEQPASPFLPDSFGPVLYRHGHVLFLRGQTLMRQPFDAAALQLTGEAAAVAEPVGNFLDRALTSASDDDTLAYSSSVSGGDVQLTWFSRSDGKPIGPVGAPGPFTDVRVSPDGTRAVLVRWEHRSGRLNRDLWMMDFARGTQSRLTRGPGNKRSPVWSPDGQRIAFAQDMGPGGVTNSASGLYVIASGGGQEAQLLLGNQRVDMSTLDRSFAPTSWSRDGKYLLFNAVSDTKTGLDLWVYPIDGQSKPFPFLSTEFRESDGQFSPDGRFVAYVSTESGREEVYVRPFSPDGDREATTARDKWIVSVQGGVNPRWSADGKELAYLSRSPNVVGMAVTVSSETGFEIGPPRELPRLPSNTVFGDASADGTRLLVGLETAPTASGPMSINLILHWPNGLKP